MLRGENFQIKSATGVENLGFFTTRFVNARTPEAAELVAIEMVRTDKSLLEALSRESKLEPKVYLEKIWPERWWKRIGGNGYSFFAMEPEK